MIILKVSLQRYHNVQVLHLNSNMIILKGLTLFNHFCESLQFKFQYDNT